MRRKSIKSFQKKVFFILQEEKKLREVRDSHGNKGLWCEFQHHIFLKWFTLIYHEIFVQIQLLILTYSSATYYSSTHFNSITTQDTFTS